MKNKSVSLDKQYWENFTLQNEDVEFLYNLMLELESPLSEERLISELITFRINREKEKMASRQEGTGKLYLPKEKYEVGEKVIFPNLGWMFGEVIKLREGNNPELSHFSVITVKMENGETKEYASELMEHRLNEMQISLQENNPYFDINYVKHNFGYQITLNSFDELRNKMGFECVGKHWFPATLLPDINLGHLNLAEAVLEMENGGPLSGKEILDRIGFPQSSITPLLEFSINVALYKDERFDEVGPTGEIQWFLKHLEPKEVLETPLTLQFDSTLSQQNIKQYNDLINGEIHDELETSLPQTLSSEDKAQITLIYPHWKAGTLPISKQIKRIFPTALETPRVRFSFVDENTGQKFPGWVVRLNHYASGLSKWYKEKNIIPGSLIQIQKGNNPGEVLISVQKRQSTREWLRTIQVNPDGNITLKLLKQPVFTTINERMTLFLTDSESLEQVWLNGIWKARSLSRTIRYFMRELIKLSPQGHVHFEEIYATTNLVKRCPPSIILNELLGQEWSQHLGDLHFRLADSGVE